MTLIDTIREQYASELAQWGQTVTLRRAGAADCVAKARVTEFRAHELGGGIVQGDRKVILLAEAVDFDPPLRRMDRIVVQGRVLNIEVVDSNSRRVGDVVVAYVLAVRG